MPNFANGKIYKLWSPQGDDIYIGSTVSSLAKRKGQHKSKYNNGINVSSKILFEKYDDVRIELIEEFPCENKMELNKREGYYIRTLECVNKRIAGRTQKEYDKESLEKKREYRENNREKIKEKKKEYCENNKDEIKEQSKKYRENNREKIKEWRENNKEYFKEWYEKNKDEIIQKQRERRAKKKNLVSVQSVVLSPEQSPE